MLRKWPAWLQCVSGDALIVGDVVYAVNGGEVKDVTALKAKLSSLAEDAPLVLNVEGMGRFQFVVLESF